MRPQAPPAIAAILLLLACAGSGGVVTVLPEAISPPPRVLAAAAPAQAPVLTIHQVNVQQGDCTLIVGPDGTTLLIDAGNVGKGASEVVPYLASIGIEPADGLDFMLATHGDEDHLGGLDEVILAGYDVRQAVWNNCLPRTAAISPSCVNTGRSITLIGETL